MTDPYTMVARLVVRHLFVDEKPMLGTPYRSMDLGSGAVHPLEERLGNTLYFGTLAGMLYSMYVTDWWSMLSLIVNVTILLGAAVLGGHRITRLLP